MNKYYSSSRLTKREEKKAYRKIFLAVVGSIALIIFIIFYGIPALLNMALFISNIKGEGDPALISSNQIIPPPTLEAPYESTNSAIITLKGYAQPALAVEIFVNGDSFKRVLTPKSGTFKVENIPLAKGENKFWAYTENSVKQKSERSEVIFVNFKKGNPKIEITEPADNATIVNDEKVIVINGMTEEGISVTINDRFVIVDTEGKFSYKLPAQVGENKLIIIATDSAGNMTKVEKTVKFQNP